MRTLQSERIGLSKKDRHRRLLKMFLAFVNYTYQQFIKQSLMLDKAVYGYFILYFVIQFYFTYSKSFYNFHRFL